MARRLFILLGLTVFLAALVSAGDLAGPRPEALGVMRATDVKGPGTPAPTLPMPKPNFNGGYHVLIAYSDDGPGPLPALLLSYPDISVVDVLNIRSSGPTLATLLTYDVVITWSNFVFYNTYAWGDLLADYVDAGGRVILAEFCHYGGTGWALQGRLISEQYSPFIPAGGGHFSGATLGAYVPGHPVMLGVTGAFDVYRDYVNLAPGAEWIASWSDGEELVAVKPGVAAVNAYPGYYNEWGSTTPFMVQLFYNLIHYVGGYTPYDLIYVDDIGRAQLCVNSETGDYSYKVLTGTGAGEYTGTAYLSMRNGTLFINSTTLYPRLQFYDNQRYHRAYGSFTYGAVRSYLDDKNTTNDPDTCQ